LFPKSQVIEADYILILGTLGAVSWKGTQAPIHRTIHLCVRELDAFPGLMMTRAYNTILINDLID